MTNMLNEFLEKVEFDSYDDFMDNFRIKVPENFNFAFDVVDRYADFLPEKIAIVWCNDNDEVREFTFMDLKYFSNKAANVFRKHGIKKGDYVMLSLKSRYEFWFCMLALHKIGAIPVPGTHMLKSKDIEYRIKMANVKMIVSISEEGVPDEIDQAHKACGDIGFVKAVVGDAREGWVDFRKEVDSASAEFPRPMGRESTHNGDILLGYFSSGTAGLPKMVQHDFTYPLAHIITAKYWQNVGDDGLHYTVADGGWAKCVWGKIYGQWIAGSAVFVYDYERFDAKKLLKMATRHGVTTFCAPPTLYRFLIKEDLTQYDFSSLQYAVVAGEPLNPEVFNKFLEYTGLKLMEGFGQTESVVTIATWPWLEPKPGSIGKPAPLYNVELMTVDGKRPDIGEEGEIVYNTSNSKPPGLFANYSGDLARTADVWHDGYYHTGDVSWQDEDGYYWFIGRADDVIKTSGYRVSPFEVESALITHPAVLECAITGAPDEIRGQVIKATIVLTKDYRPTEKLKRELQEHVKSVTAPYKYPREIDFVTELPKTISGKIRRVQIRGDDK